MLDALYAAQELQDLPTSGLLRRFPGNLRSAAPFISRMKPSRPERRSRRRSEAIHFLVCQRHKSKLFNEIYANQSPLGPGVKAGLMAGPLFVRRVVLRESNRSPNKKSMGGELHLHYLVNGNYEEYDGG
jgi:hypothetical protein